MSNTKTSRDIICDKILSIMETYHEQSASPGGVDTPGGLEHIGDVWSLFLDWETMLKEQPASWSEETMAIINKLTPDIKGKAFDPDWFLLRERFESFEAMANKTADVRNSWCAEYTKLRDACEAFRDTVLNQRHQLEAPCLDNDQTNAVLSAFDDALGEWAGRAAGAWLWVWNLRRQKKNTTCA